MALARRPQAFDLALALGLVVAGQATVWGDSADAGAKAITVPVALVVGAAVGWRRRAPLGSLVVVLAAVLGQQLALRLSPALFFLVVLLISVSTAAARLPARGALWAGGLSLVCAEATVLLDPGATPSDKEFTALVLVGAPWFAGRALHRQRERSTELTAHNDRLRIERDQRARDAVAAERTRIARDLHDVIAHSVSVMIVQAGAAEQVLDASPARAREPLEAIRATGKTALVDMRRLLGVLRTDADGLGLAPQPTLEDLTALAERFRATGIDVELAMSGGGATLAPGIEMTVYRVCQEALTNALRHGGGRVTMAVDLMPDAVEIAVLDDGSGRPTERTPAGGHGLTGMRERVALYGGELHAARRPEGGFEVRARIPLEHGAP